MAAFTLKEKNTIAQQSRFCKRVIQLQYVLKGTLREALKDY